MTKLQITLTPQETVALGYGASNLGYSLTKFVKFLLGQKAVEVSNSIPVYQMSKKAIRDTEVAWSEYKQGKTKKISSLLELIK